MANENLSHARRAKNDEFYTQYSYIEKEMNAYLDRDPNVFADKTVLLPCDDPEWSNFTKYFAQNFQKLRLKKLISTSYAPDSKLIEVDKQPTLFELESPQFDPTKTEVRGKIYTLTKDMTGDDRIDLRDVEWEYLEGDGDFRSDEVWKLRDEADVIITNPPFSLFREFLTWIDPTKKKFVIIGSMNAITYKEVFPFIRKDQMWLGATSNGSDMVFAVPEGTQIRKSDKEKAKRLGYDGSYTRLGNSCWFGNLDHGKRHEPIPLMTEAENIKFSTNKQVRGVGYTKYDNHDAIEVPIVKAIPSDYKGVMGVPISFLDKYSPEQFEIMKYPDDKEGPGQWIPDVDGTQKYARILIKHRRNSDEDNTE